MQGVGKIASLLLTGAAACTLLAACHGSSSTTPSTVPPTVGTFLCPVVANPTPTTTPGIAVTCTVTGAADADGTAVTYNWNFGDQTLATSTQPITGNGVTHIYAQPGSYQVAMEVVDDHGTGATRIETITVPVSAVNSSVTPDGIQNWAWLSGAKTANAFGVFQTQFTASALNQPGARQSGASWTDSQGHLWMFGGVGYDSTGTTGYLNDLWMFNATSNQWTWVSGSNRANSTGTFPALTGITASTNVISARSSAATWTSTVNGTTQFWLFGGYGADKYGNASYLNDLWMLNSQTGEATWEAGSGVGNTVSVVSTQGVASTSNAPSGRSFASTWVDSNGVFWLFGGQTVNASGTGEYLDDLWSYDPNPVDQATPPKHPNGQKGWVLVSAATTATTFNTAGVYGTLNTAATANFPGARVSAQTWADASGNLWLFGGNGFDTNDSLGSLNDMWMYNTVTNTWTWVAGSNAIAAISVYGANGSTVATTSGVPNTPGARVGTSGWVDSSHTLWMFGGSGSDSTSTTTADDGGGALNELWAFNPTTKLWAFMGGVKIAGTAGVYITQTASPTTFSPYNTPGSRVWSTSWSVNGNFYLFGGSGLDSIGTSGYLNDLWTVQTVQPL